RQAQLQIACVGVHLADGVADDAVGVMVEVRAGGRQRADDAALDQRNQATLVQAGGRHRAAQGQEDAAVLLHGAPHQLVGCPLLPADVGAERMLQKIVRRLAARDRPRIDGAGLLEGLAKPGASRHGGRAIYTIKSSACARWSSSNGPRSCSRSRATATSSCRGQRAAPWWRKASWLRATSWRTEAGWASTGTACSSASPTGAGR